MRFSSSSAGSKWGLLLYGRRGMNSMQPVKANELHCIDCHFAVVDRCNCQCREEGAVLVPVVQTHAYPGTSEGEEWVKLDQQILPTE